MEGEKGGRWQLAVSRKHCKSLANNSKLNIARYGFEELMQF